MKKIITFFLLIPFISFTQANDPETIYLLEQHEKQMADSAKNFCDSVISKYGFSFKKGQIVKIGTGSIPDGSFKFTININDDCVNITSKKDAAFTATFILPNYIIKQMSGTGAADTKHFVTKAYEFAKKNIISK